MNRDGSRNLWMRGQTSRREFFKAPVVAGAAGALLGAGFSRGTPLDETKQKDSAGQTRESIINEYDPANVKVAQRVSADIRDDDLLLLKQIGLRWADVLFGTNEGFDHIRRTQERFARFGIKIYAGRHFAYRNLKIQLGQAGRDHKESFSCEQTVRAYKDLAKVERAFRCLKTVDLNVRPIYHWLDRRIRAHVFLCMLAYYVQWHMRRKLAPLLFDDHDREAAEAQRRSIVAPAPRSDQAKHKDATKRTHEDEPVHSFRTLLEDLATITKNRIRIDANPPIEFYQLTQPTPSQQHALDLLGVPITP